MATADGPGRPAAGARRPGRLWPVASITMLVVNALLVWVMIRDQPWYAVCERAYPPSVRYADRSPLCRRIALEYGMSSLAFILLMLATGVVAVVLGVVGGRRRHRFAHGRWVWVGVLGIGAPWALAGYAAGYGVGRLLPRYDPAARRYDPAARQLDPLLGQGWQTALALYSNLAAGHPPPAVLAPGFLDRGPIHLDAPMTYARYYATTVTYGQTSTIAFGSPLFVAGAMTANAIGNSAARRRAMNLAAPQWREQQQVRVIVTGTTTWCNVDGRWLAFDHEAVVEYLMDGPVCVLTFEGVEPLHLAGPSAWCHAVLFAYLRYGPQEWHAAPFLQQVRAAARAGIPRPGA